MRKQPLHTGTELLHNCILPLNHRFEIKAVSDIMETESRCTANLIHNSCIAAEGLCRNTSLIQTCSTYRPALNQSDLHSPFCSQKGGLITARSGSYYDYFHIVMIILPQKSCINTSKHKVTLSSGSQSGISQGPVCQHRTPGRSNLIKSPYRCAMRS